MGISVGSGSYCTNAIVQIISFLLVYGAVDYYKRPRGGVVIWEGSFGCEFLRGLMCAEGMGYGRRWVLRGTGTASEHPGVP